MILTAISHEGQQFDVDLDRVSGWDAITFRHTTGIDLEDALVEMLPRVPLVKAADVAVVAWLWWRQTSNPMATMFEVAATLRAVPSADDDEDAA